MMIANIGLFHQIGIEFFLHLIVFSFTPGIMLILILLFVTIFVLGLHLEKHLIPYLKPICNPKSLARVLVLLLTTRYLSAWEKRNIETIKVCIYEPGSTFKLPKDTEVTYLDDNDEEHTSEGFMIAALPFGHTVCSSLF